MKLILVIDVPDFALLRFDSSCILVPLQKHITLQFFDNVTSRELTEIKRRLDTFSFKSFSLSTSAELSAFANWERIRTLYVGLQSVQLDKLVMQIQSLFRDMISPKPFVPHITVGRVRGKISDDEKEKLREIVVDSQSILVSDLCLYELDLTENGVVYKLCKKVKLD